MGMQRAWGNLCLELNVNFVNFELKIMRSVAQWTIAKIPMFIYRYVKVYLLPDKSKSSKKKTTHRRKTLNPQWDETIKVWKESFVYFL